MKRSDNISNLSKALASFHSLVGKIGKDAKNPFFKSSYASLPHILTEIQEPLEKSGLVITQFPDGDGRRPELSRDVPEKFQVAHGCVL